MNSRCTFLRTAVFLFLAIPLILATDAWATRYVGDGATPSAPGGWDLPPVSSHLQCLECHGSGANHYTCGGFCITPDKSTYLMTGHKNMLRKVTPGIPWAGPDGDMYSASDPYGSGSIFDWNAGTVLVDGLGPPRNLLYVFAGWMSPDELNTIYDGGFTGEQYPHGNYDCGRCHTSGYRFDATGPLPTQSDAQFSRVPTTGSSATSSWYLDGIQCERCHRDVANEAGGHNCYIGGALDATKTTFADCTSAGGAWTVNVPTFEKATALCIECHRQESLDSDNNLALSTNLEVSDGGPPYSPFFDASIGQAFLNSPHARFTGTLSQTTQNVPDLSVLMTGAYSSSFADSGKNMGCAGCHDVHQSLVTAVGAVAPLKKQCGDCHTTKATYLMSRILHPSGGGTPLGDGSDTNAACATCHMPDAYHLFRISTDVNYSTFPTEVLFNSGQTTANTAPEGAFADAVWVDLDLACGQCHGGSSGPGGTANGAGYLDKATLAGLAAGIHNDQPTATFGHKLGSPNTLRVAIDASASVCLSGICAYDWNWGDGSTPHGTQVIEAHTYGSPGAKMITLTVTDPGTMTSATKSKSVAVYTPDTPPTASGTCVFDANTWTETVTDTSSDDNGVKQVTVSWGDGGILFSDTTAPFGPATHTYLNAGTYTIVHKAIDTIGQQNSRTCTASPAAFTISGTVFTPAGVGSPLGGALVTVKKGGIVVGSASSATNGTFTTTSLKPGTYTLTVTRSGYTFTVPAATIAVGPSSVGNNVTALTGLLLPRRTPSMDRNGGRGGVGTTIGGATITPARPRR